MEINFKKFPYLKNFRTQEFIYVDIQADIADVVYENIPGAMGSSMARRIYESETGLADFNENELNQLEQLFSLGLFKAGVYDGYMKLKNDKHE